MAGQQKPPRFVLRRAEVRCRVRQLRVDREHRRARHPVRHRRQMRRRRPRKRHCPTPEKVRERSGDEKRYNFVFTLNDVGLKQLFRSNCPDLVGLKPL